MGMEVSVMRIRSWTGIVLSSCIALAAAGVVGCGGSAATEQVSSANSAATRAPVAQNAHGPVRLVGAALGDVPLTPSQRAEIEQLATDAETRHAGARAARRDMMLALAAQVEAGSIDRDALRPHLDALVAAANASQPGDRAGLERLHAILGPDQRTAFVDALEARLHERMSAFRASHPWKSWSDDLGLTDQQRAQIKAAMEAHFQAAKAGSHEHGGPWEARQHGAKVLSAFKQDRFVLDEIAPARDISRQATRASEHFLGMAEAALPVFTPEQRAIAAKKLREQAEQVDAADSLLP
jgi:Spy/CpxP family protein refolding chaperone